MVRLSSTRFMASRFPLRGPSRLGDSDQGRAQRGARTWQRAQGFETRKSFYPQARSRQDSRFRVGEAALNPVLSGIAENPAGGS